MTAALIESARRRAGGVSERDLSAQLDEIAARLAAIEAAAPSREPPEGPPDHP